MTPTQLKEEISKAYLHAVAAINGFAVGTWSQDHGCVDTTVSSAGPLGTGLLSRPKLDVQLKATEQTDVDHGEYIAWQLDADHYASLIEPSALPIVLVILLLPTDGSPSVEHTPEQLIIRRCAYWVHLRGAEPIADGQKTKVIHVPKNNVFSPSALRVMLTRVSEGTDL